MYHIWADWGLITIHAKGEPLGKVIASMERQGHATIKTDMPGDTPVTMDVVRVHLPDALETLSVVTESRWRLLYFVAGDKATLMNGETAWASGTRPDGWTMVSFPLGNMFATDDDAPPPDPRKDTWTPQTAAPASVQAYFAEAAQITNAGFAYPNSWSPTVNKMPPAGEVAKVVPKLVRGVGGHEDQVFFLSKNGRGGPRPPDGGATAGGPGLQFNPALIAARMQAEINRMPSDQRAEAQASFDAERAFRESLKNMTDDERRAAFLQHMQDPNVQQMIANRMDGREARMNHDQRMSRYQGMVNRKLTAMGKVQ